MFIGGPGGPGGPLGPLGLLCWIPVLLCCFAPPPPPPSTVIVVDSNGTPVNRTPQAGPSPTPIATAVPVANTSYREVKALEFREGDIPKKYFLEVPLDLNYSQTIQVELGGSLFTVKVPDYIRRGEKIIVIAPGPVHGNA